MSRSAGRRRIPRWAIAAFLAVALSSILAAEPPARDSEVPNVALESLDGELHELEERTGEGTTGLVFFRGVW